MALVFIDFEASSLEPGGFPIELGWVGENGKGDSRLIKPAPGWNIWNAGSEQVHGISLSTLRRDGEPHHVVAARAMDIFRVSTVVADQPQWDGAWLNMLLAAAGMEACPVKSLHSVLLEACYPLLKLLTPPDHPGRRQSELVVRGLCTEAITDAHNAEGQAVRVRHRALPDAESNWKIWKDVESRVAAMLSRALPPGHPV